MAYICQLSGPLQAAGIVNMLVSMTSIPKPEILKPKGARNVPPGSWRLQDAKARFSELVRRVRSEGPQHVTVHGREEVVVISAEEFYRLRGDRSGKLLVAAMQASPYRDFEIEPPSVEFPVRDVVL